MAFVDNFRSSGRIKEIFNKMDYAFKEQTPTLALKWIDSYLNWINESIKSTGKTVKMGSSGSTFNLINSDDIFHDSEVRNEHWLNLDKFERIKILQRLSILIKDNSLLFGQLAALEQGVPLQDVVNSDIPYFVQYFRLCISMPLQLFNYTKVPVLGGDKTYFVKISQFIPFHELCWYVVPSLICGHTVKLKVDNRAMLVTLLFMKLCQEVGIPEEVIRLQSIESMDINDFHYGHSVALVYESVDLDSALDSIIEGAWGHQGLVPWSIRRVLVHEPLSKDFVEKLYKKMLQLKFGNAFDRFGIIGKSYIKEISTAVEDVVLEATSEGFEVLRVHQGDKGFVKPTAIIGRPQCLFENTLPLPVITVEVFRTVGESIKLVKNSHFFTSASLWTNSHSVLHKAAYLLMKETEIQTVWLNVHGLLDPAVPFVVQDINHGVKEDLLLFIFRKSFPEIDIMFNPEIPDLLARLKVDGVRVTALNSILKAASKAGDLWNNLGSFKRSSVLFATAMELLNKKTLFHVDIFSTSETGDYSLSCAFVECLVEFLINISSVTQNLDTAVNSCKEDSIVISNRRRGVILLHTKGIKNILILLQLLITFIAYGNSLIIIADEVEVIDKFCDILKFSGVELNVINVIKYETSTKEYILNEVTPSSEVLAINAFTSKSVWLVK